MIGIGVSYGRQCYKKEKKWRKERGEEGEMKRSGGERERREEE